MSAVIGRPCRARRLDPRDDRVHLRPVRLARRLQVVDLRGHAGLARDADQLVHRLQQPVALAAQVRDVLAAVGRGRLAQLDQLLGRGVEPGRVDERGADARARRPPSPGAPARACAPSPPAVGARSSWPTTCSRTVAAPMYEATLGETPFFSRKARYSASVVHATSKWMSPCCAFIARLHLLGERAHRAALAEDLGGDALADVALRAAVRDQRLRRPRQHVDEAGGDGEAGGVDDGPACAPGQVADGGDAVAADADVGAAARRRRCRRRRSRRG